MRRKLFVLFAIVAAVLMLCASALAAEDPLHVSVQLSTAEFTEPQTISISIQVTNASDEDMPGPVTLYDPNNQKIEAFGEPILAAGTSKVWEGTWNVTQQQLEEGKIRFAVRYYFNDESGKLASKTRGFNKPITYKGAVTALEVNRTISPTTAANGQKVTITYDVINTGNTDLTNVTITENKSIASKPMTIEKVAAGTKESAVFTVTMGKKDLTSSATIAYTAAGKNGTVTKDEAVIAYGEMNMTASLACDKVGGIPGDKAKLTLTLKNSGKTDYTNVTVSDPLLGQLFEGQTIPAGKTVTLEKEVVINDTASYQFTVSALNASGRTVETTTSAVTVKSISPSDVVTLTVSATADREIVYALPGTVKFRVAVTNNSSFDVKNVSVSASGVTLYTFPTILAGETREFTRDVSISMAGQYQFSASTKDQLNETVRFTSNIIYISYATPTAVPTKAPIVTPPVPQLEEMPTEAEVMAETAQLQQVLKLAAMILGGIGGLGVLLLVIGLIRSTVRKSRIKDQLNVVVGRDYSEPNSHPKDFEAAPKQDEAAPEAEAEPKPEE